MWQGLLDSDTRGRRQFIGAMIALGRLSPAGNRLAEMSCGFALTLLATQYIVGRHGILRI